MNLLLIARLSGSCLLLSSLLSSGAQGQLRVMTYNVTNYASGRVSDIQTALFASFQGRSAKPDLLMGQEFLTASGLNSFVSAMSTAPGSPGNYGSAPFFDGPDTDSVLIYQMDKLVLDGTVIVAAGGNTPLPPRNVMRYDLHLNGYSQAATQFSVYSLHMKAGTGTDDLARRLREAQIVRADAQALGRPFYIGGDLNLRSSGESSFIELTGSKANNIGRFFDPIKTPGGCNNTVSMKFVHTQDPATGFGGMDDRYDFILFSQGLIDGNGFDYIGNPNIALSTTTWDDPNHSYRSWGNDGTSFNTALTVTNNQMVGPAIATGIAAATDNSACVTRRSPSATTPTDRLRSASVANSAGIKINPPT